MIQRKVKRIGARENNQEFLFISEENIDYSPRASISHVLVPVFSRLSRVFIIFVQKNWTALRGSFLIGVPSFVLPPLMIATMATQQHISLDFLIYIKAWILILITFTFTKSESRGLNLDLGCSYLFFLKASPCTCFVTHGSPEQPLSLLGRNESFLIGGTDDCHHGHSSQHHHHIINCFVQVIIVLRYEIQKNLFF